jgi:hypothetical protein
MCLITIDVTGSSDMSKELNQLAKEFGNQNVGVLRTNLNLYQSSISIVAAPFLKDVAAQTKKSKSPTVTLIAIIVEAA